MNSTETTSKTFDFSEVADRDALVARRYLRRDDFGDLRIYKYSAKCHYERQWPPFIRATRGVIFNRLTAEPVAVPLPKFFNVNEPGIPDAAEEALPWNDIASVFEKVDGWLGILYRHAGRHHIATACSFRTPMALWATERLRARHADLAGLPDDVTLVFEIVHPETHVIVDYHDAEKLVLLAAFNRFTGVEYPWARAEQWAKTFDLATPARMSGWGYIELRDAMASGSGLDAEGFVVQFNDGRRIKVKFNDYVNRFRIRAAEKPRPGPRPHWMQKY